MANAKAEHIDQIKSHYQKMGVELEENQIFGILDAARDLTATGVTDFDNALSNLLQVLKPPIIADIKN